MPRVNPCRRVRHVGALAGAYYRRSRKGVPLAYLRRRSVTYFGRQRVFGLFLDCQRVGTARTPVQAALWLVQGPPGPHVWPAAWAERGP